MHLEKNSNYRQTELCSTLAVITPQMDLGVTVDSTLKALTQFIKAVAKKANRMLGIIQKKRKKQLEVGAVLRNLKRRDRGF